MSTLLTIGKAGRLTTHTMTAIAGEEFATLAQHA
jgi:hypothetical protein